MESWVWCFFFWVFSVCIFDGVWTFLCRLRLYCARFGRFGAWDRVQGACFYAFVAVVGVVCVCGWCVFCCSREFFLSVRCLVVSCC